MMQRELCHSLCDLEQGQRSRSRSKGQIINFRACSLIGYLTITIYYNGHPVKINQGHIIYFPVSASPPLSLDIATSTGFRGGGGYICI